MPTVGGMGCAGGLHLQTMLDLVKMGIIHDSNGWELFIIQMAA